MRKPVQRWTGLLAVALICACHAKAKDKGPPAAEMVAANTQEERTMGRPMQRSKAVPMVEGPAIRPAGPLLEWLRKSATKAAGGRRRFRLPVAVRFTDEHHLALGAAAVGLRAGEADGLSLSLDDSGLGVGLAETLAERCPREKESCAVWLEGYFGPLVPEQGAEAEHAGAWPFSVLQVHELIEGAAEKAGDVRALCEAGA